jgi:hypothetical protein
VHRAMQPGAAARPRQRLRGCDAPRQLRGGGGGGTALRVLQGLQGLQSGRCAL